MEYQLTVKCPICGEIRKTSCAEHDKQGAVCISCSKKLGMEAWLKQAK